MDTSDDMETHANPEQHSIFDLWTGDPQIDADLEHMRNMDWSSTSIGSMYTWPHEMLTLLYLTMLSSQPQIFLLGPDQLLLYNTASGRIFRDHHPSYFGKPIDTLERLQPQKQRIEVLVETARARRRAANGVNMPFFFLNNGRLEEMFISVNMVLLPSPLEGLHATSENTTETVVSARRAEALDILSRECNSATDLPCLWSSLLKGISESPEEFPFSLLYSARIDPDQDSSSNSSRAGADNTALIFDLEGTVGEFSPPPQSSLDLTTDKKEYVRCMNLALTSHVPVMLRSEDGTLPSSWSQASCGRGYGDRCTEAIVLTSTLKDDNDVQALLIVGLGPRRPYDEAYEAWIRQLHGTIANNVASIIVTQAQAFKQEVAAQSAKLRRVMLEKELALQRREATLATGKVQRLLAITRLNNVALFEYASTGELIEANDVFYELTGYPKDPDLNEKFTFLTVIMDEDVEFVKLQWGQLISGAHYVTFDMRCKNDSAEGLWLHVACASVVDENGVVISVTGCATSINAQKREARRRAEISEELRMSEARLLAFTENAPIGILVMDPESSGSYVNNTWIELTGHPRVKAEEIDLSSVIYPDDLDFAKAQWKHASDTKMPVEFQIRLKRQWRSDLNDGEPQGQAWVLVTAFTELNDNGSLCKIMSAMIDISHLKFSEMVQRSRLEEAIEAKRQQENFIDMTCHEIRNPLGAVIQCADSILDSLSEIKELVAVTTDAAENARCSRLNELLDSSIDAVEIVTSCSMHQKRMTDDILSLSKLDSKLLQIRPAAFNAVKFLDYVKSTFVVEAGRADVVLNTRLDDSLSKLGDHWVLADSGRVHQVLVNLVMNAINYTENQSGDRTVTVLLGASNTQSKDLPVIFTPENGFQSNFNDPTDLEEGQFYLWFTVQDTGCGMDAETNSRLFTHYTRASPKTYKKYGGSGLGLFVSQKLVELQNGEIGLTSEAGVGSTFAFFVKAYTTAAPSTAVQERQTSNTDHTAHAVIARHQALPKLTRGISQGPINDDVAGSSNQSSPARLNLLLVEDNIINQRVLKKQLTKHGYNVHTADNGQEALDFIQTTRNWKKNQTTATKDDLAEIHTVLMDIMMPVMGGIECTKRIRALQDDGDIVDRIPIIAVTANARPEQKKEAIGAGINEIVLKPFQVRDLIPIIDRLSRL